MRNDCGDVVVRSALRDKSHYHHVTGADPVKAARSTKVRRCITRARNRIFLSLAELTPVAVATVWLVTFRLRSREQGERSSPHRGG